VLISDLLLLGGGYGIFTYYFGTHAVFAEKWMTGSLMMLPVVLYIVRYC